MPRLSVKAKDTHNQILSRKHLARPLIAFAAVDQPLVDDLCEIVIRLSQMLDEAYTDGVERGRETSWGTLR